MTIENLLTREEWTNLDLRCKNQEMIIYDPCALMGCSFYDKCLVCTDYSSCGDYEPLKTSENETKSNKWKKSNSEI